MRRPMFRTFLTLLTIAVFLTPALADRTKGVVKWYNADKRMGFLQSANGDEIFVGASAISASCNGTLHEGQSVEFEIITVPGGNNTTKRTAKDVTCR
jgi:cold shock CspA family protein